MNKKIYLILLIVFILFEALSAQGGPIYSRYGVGDLIHSSTGRRLGFGGLGLAVIDKDYVDEFNPASWTKLTTTRFGLSAKYIGANYSDLNTNSFFTNVIFSGFNIGFPLDRELGISMVLGLVPISATRYDIQKDIVDENFGSYSNEYLGNGSLSKIFLGTSVIIPSNTSIGASFEYYTGTNDYTSSQVFPDNSEFTDISFQTQYKYRGIGGTFSAISTNMLNLFHDTTNSELRLSGLLNVQSDLTTDTLIVTNTSIGELERLTGETTTSIPYKVILGASYAWDKKYIILFDYLFQPFSKYEFDGTTNKNLKDLTRFSLGFEYKNKKLGMHASAFEQMSYRLGISYEETQYTFNGININQYSLHGGFSVPFGDFNLIDFGIAAGIRGTTDSNLIKEKFVSATFTLTLGELWFVRENR